MFVGMCIQGGKMDGCVFVGENRKLFYCIPVHMIGFAKGIVQLLSTRFQVGFYWTG